MRWRGRVLFLAGLGSLASGACTEGGGDPQRAEAGLAASYFDAASDAAADASAPERPADGAPPVEAAAAEAAAPMPSATADSSTPMRPVLVGLNSVPSGSGALPDLEVIALGSNATTLAYAWGTDLEVALQRASMFADAGVQVMFSIDIVSGRRALSSAFDATFRGELESAIDQILAQRLPLAALTLGNGLDLALSRVEPLQREQLLEIVPAFLTYASQHADRLPATRVTVGTTGRGWLTPGPEMLLWAELAEAVTVSWFAISSTGQAADSSTAGEELDEILEPIFDAGKPVYLREAAYPSAVDSSQDRQNKFYKDLFDSLTGRGEQIPLLSVTRLDDPTDAECDTYKLDFELPDASDAARCSIGLRTAGIPKKAFYTVIDAMMRSAAQATTAR